MHKRSHCTAPTKSDSFLIWKGEELINYIYKCEKSLRSTIFFCWVAEKQASITLPWKIWKNIASIGNFSNWLTRNHAVREVLWPIFPGETRGWMCAPREMCFLAHASGVCRMLGKIWAESCRWRKVDFQFCILCTFCPPPPPTSLGARRGFTWGVWRISGVLPDVYLITCARDVGTRRIHLALVIEFFGKNTKCIFFFFLTQYVTLW